MALSIAEKQNYIYAILIVLTVVGTILLYRVVNSEWILFREAETSYQNKEYAAAINFYNKSVEAGMPPSKVAINLANSYVSVGNFKEAIALYKGYLLEYPKDTNVRLALARVLSWSGDLKESESEYKKILDDKKHENHH